jgi:alkanesulfonate monooxygenase SsuD/methylene tetrahydromethanopterin reductase-like flavin-dependent oxidoreductase (luciferase family)
VALTAAAAVTRRIRIMSIIIVAPLRNAGILAKQAASLDALSGGRLTLGLGIGARDEDYRAAPASFERRGPRFGRQLALMKRVWSGQAVAEDVAAVGPPPVQPGGPELLIGANAPAAMRRLARWADGYISAGGAPPQRALAGYQRALEAWQAADKAGRPRFVGSIPCVVGAEAAERAAANIRAYYAYRGATSPTGDDIPSSPEAIRAAIHSYEEIGMDELVLRPHVAELDQVERLAELVA